MSIFHQGFEETINYDSKYFSGNEVFKPLRASALPLMRKLVWLLRQSKIIQ
jgi:hypothetical protein